MTSQQLGGTRIRSDVLTRFLDQATVSGGNLVIGVLLARALGPADFGVFAVLWTVTLLANSIHWALITSPMQSIFTALEPESWSKMFSALLTYVISIGIISSLVALLVANYLVGTVPTLKETIAITSALVCILIQEFVRRWLLVTERSRYALLSDSIRSLGACVILYYVHMSDKASISEAFVAIGFSALIACIPIAKDLTSAHFNTRNTWNYGKRHWDAGRWLMPFALLQWLIASAPIFMLSILVDSAAAGGYRAAVILIAPIIVLTEAYETFLPLRSAWAFHAGGVATLKQTLVRYLYPMLGMTMIYCLLISVFAEFFLQNIFGSNFQSYHLLVVLLACAAPFQNLGYIKNVQLRALSIPKGILVSEVVAGGLLILMYLSIPLGQQGQGAAAAAIVAQAIKLAVLSWFAREA